MSASPTKEPTVAYGFGSNGRVHPDVVRSPVSALNSYANRQLPGIQRNNRTRKIISDNI